MNTNVPPSAGSAITILREVTIWVFAIFVFWLITINRSPNILRPLSMLLRTGYTVVIPILYVALYLVFRLRGWIGSLLSLSLTLSIFALALAGAWVTGQTESGLLSGVIPMFDSATYYLDSLRLLAGAEFSPVSTRRPLFIAFFTSLLWIANHNLLYALAFLTLLVSLACYLLAREINKTHGPAIAAFVLIFVFVYYRFHSGVVRTENLGILFGVLGTALIWRGISIRQPFYLLAGIFLTSLGIIARAGAFFILPLLILWGAVAFKQSGVKISWQFLLVGTLVIIAAFMVNQVIMKSFGTRDVIPFGNFSYSFYGLASGGNSWADVLKIYPQADHLEIYRMAFELVLEQPHLLVQGVMYNYSMFFSNSNYGWFSYMGGEGGSSGTISYWALLVLTVLASWNWYRHREDPYMGFIMVSAAGLLISVPFLPPTDAFRLRAYATSIVILAMLTSMGLRAILTNLRVHKRDPKDAARISERTLPAFSAVVVAVFVLGPFAARGTDLIPALEPARCAPDLSSVIVRYNPSVMVHFVPQTTPLLDWAPAFHIRSFRRNVHDFPNIEFIDWALESVVSQNALFYALDYRSFQGVLVRAETESLPSSPALLEICGRREENLAIAQFDIFHGTSIDLFGPE